MLLILVFQTGGEPLSLKDLFIRWFGWLGACLGRLSARDVLASAPSPFPCVRSGGGICCQLPSVFPKQSGLGLGLFAHTLEPFQLFSSGRELPQTIQAPE